MIRVGLLGFGFMGGTHFGFYRNMPEVRVSGIYDLDPEKVKRGEVAAGNIGDAGGKPDLTGITVTDRPEELVNSPDIDLVDVCLPTYLHAKYGIMALDAGKHVLCEKPMATAARDCEGMLKAARKSGKKFMIGQCLRFWPEYSLVKQMVEEKRYGDVVSAFFRRVSPTPVWSCRNWLLDEKKSGGALLDLHLHDIDYILHLFGKPVAVRSFGRKNISGPRSGFDCVVTTYGYRNRTLVVAEGGWHFHAKFPFNMSFTIRCRKGTISYDMAQPKTLSIFKDDGTAEYPEAGKTTGWENEIRYFIDCVKNDKQVEISTPEESKLAVRIAVAETRSAETGRPVVIR